MRRIIIYCIILSGILLIPVERMEIRDLEPIQAVWMYLEDGNIVLETVTEDVGRGESVQKALEDMKTKSSGIVYLDTAQFLLVSENAQEQVAALAKYLKDEVKIGLWEGGDLIEAARYMQSHKIGVKLGKWSREVKLPKLPI